MFVLERDAKGILIVRGSCPNCGTNAPSIPVPPKENERLVGPDVEEILMECSECGKYSPVMRMIKTDTALP